MQCTFSIFYLIQFSKGAKMTNAAVLIFSTLSVPIFSASPTTAPSHGCGGCVFPWVDWNNVTQTTCIDDPEVELQTKVHTKVCKRLLLLLQRIKKTLLNEF